jgi:hypothetical protein
LKIVVLPAAGARKPDPVFYFAGGPGGSAIETVTRAGQSISRICVVTMIWSSSTSAAPAAPNLLSCNLYGDKNDMAAYFGELFVPERLRACRAELKRSPI